MVALSIRFRAGRFHATPWGRMVNEAAVEWPPSPWRLLRALTSSWLRTARDASGSQVGELLWQLTGPPTFVLPPAASGHFRHFMPRDEASFTAPTKRDLIFDAFVTLDPNAAVTVLWEHVRLDQPKEALLARLASGVPYLGRAESWCDVSVLSSTLASPTWADGRHSVSRPVTGELATSDTPVRVLCPTRWDAASALDEAHPLMIDTGVLRHARRQLDPPGARWVTYGRPVDALDGRPGARATSRAAPRIARFFLASRNGCPLPRLTQAVTAAESFRDALVGVDRRIASDTETSWILSGRVDGAPARGHRHAYYLPTDEDGDGRLDHLTIVARARLGPGERRAIQRLRTVSLDERVGLRPLLLGFMDDGTSRGTGPALLATARTWRSITPYVPSRFLRHGPNGLERQVRWDVGAAGLPPVRRVEVVGPPPAPGRPTWSAWRRWKRRGPSPPQARGWGLRLELEQPTTGPVALGYGSHFGLGLFVPDEGTAGGIS